MPIVHINLLEGRNLETRDKLAVAVTETVADTLACPPERIRVILNEVPRTQWYVGGQSLASTS